MNAERNMAFARQAKNGGRIDMPVLFLHARLRLGLRDAPLAPGRADARRTAPT